MEYYRKFFSKIKGKKRAYRKEIISIRFQSIFNSDRIGFDGDPEGGVGVNALENRSLTSILVHSALIDNVWDLGPSLFEDIESCAILF
jgi:hypothetical protein